MGKNLKVLWFSGVIFSDKASNASGSWIYAMADSLMKTGAIQLFNITNSYTKSPIRQNSGEIMQWLLPYQSLRSNGLPGKKAIREIQRIVNEIQPDIIHIWGTEGYWGLLTARGIIHGNIILEIQGLKFAIEKYFYSGLSFSDIIKCFGIKELLKPSGSLPALKSSFKKWGIFEKEMLLKHDFISTQSDWTRAHIKSINPNAKMIYTHRSLRNEFQEAGKWELDRATPYQIFTSLASLVPYKGLHVLLESVSILKKKYPLIKLVVACHISHGIRQDGYTRWLRKKIKKLLLSENIRWIGRLNALDIIQQMYQANVVVVPSFVESYCLGLEEALSMGVPTVAAFAGAMPELAVNEKTALYFSPGEAVMCAEAIEKFFIRKDFTKMISQNVFNAKNAITNKNITETQLAIYMEVIKK
jgi:glycosyltransferase involved in cell wall biosynthesis